MRASIRDPDVFGRSIGLKVRRRVAGRRSRALIVPSITMLLALAGCSSSVSTDSTSLSHKTIADLFGSSSRSVPAPVVATPPPSNVSGGIADQAGVPPPAAPATYAANAPAPPVPGAPTTYVANTTVPPPASSEQRPAAQNPFYSLFNSLKGGTQECSLPTEPCDNTHRVQN